MKYKSVHGQTSNRLYVSSSLRQTLLFPNGTAWQAVEFLLSQTINFIAWHAVSHIKGWHCRVCQNHNINLQTLKT